MAKTSISTSNALRKQIWIEQLFRDIVAGSYFKSFTGKDSNSMVQEKTELEKQQGDKMTFGVRYKLKGDGVTSGQTLEGKEESLRTADFAVELEQYRHAVRDNGRMSRKRAMFSIDDESRSALVEWGSEKIDKLLFQAALASPTRILYPNVSYTATTQLTANDVITPDLISKLKVGAMTGWAGRQIPMRPIKIGGKAHYILVISPDVKYDLEKDPTYAQAVREAEARSKDNPIFTGALAMWNNVVVHEHERLGELADVRNFGAGADVPGSTCLFLGAQALCLAWGQRPNVVQETFDYGNENGFAIEMIMKAAKPKFTEPGQSAADFAVAALKVARTKTSDYDL